ncbi:hypothetical protein DS831_00075 [Bombilactobacillus bombi]|uniref:DUF1093 domain-containing protein n=1 Tax=Bombilactobacillus bombi TaxID=1303590 RepID=A0A3R6WB19_9LACO|nr:DUF1093 domain-containing protein [Bombilactobacillus bombi]RHW51772.1 hypothetical protein DS831_00075 [Bombilactobacillus bombi]
MKKFFSSILVILVIICFLPFVLPLLTHDQTNKLAMVVDSINPILSKKELYAKVSTSKPFIIEKPQRVSQEKNYLYRVTAYDKNGKSRKLLCKSFGQPAKIQVGDYLLIKAKGQTVKFWKIINRNKIPKNIIKEMN